MNNHFFHQSNEYPDYELNGDGEHLEASGTSKATLDILPFIEYCLPAALANIKSSRTENHLDVLKQLFREKGGIF